MMLLMVVMCLVFILHSNFSQKNQKLEVSFFLEYSVPGAHAIC